MTAYTTITNGQIDADSPIDEALMTALRDNPIAITEGSSGAPKIQAAALEQAGGSEAVTRATIREGAVGQTEIGASAVGQGEVKLANQQSSAAVASVAYANIAFTGAGYTIGWGIGDSSANRFNVVSYASGGVYVNGIGLYNTDAEASRTYYFSANYFQASPPYDLGDGEIPLFVFVEIDSLGNVVRVDLANDPPWAYNGPTDIRAHIKTKDGRKFRRVRAVIAEFGNAAAARASLGRAQFLERMASDGLVAQEITQAIKNADMTRIPHPFIGNPLPPGNSIVMLDGQSPLMARLLRLQEITEPGETIADLLRDGYLRFDNAALPRRAPPGVIAVEPRWRITP